MATRATILPADWTPGTWHGVDGAPREWRLGPDGIETRDHGRWRAPVRTDASLRDREGLPLRDLARRLYGAHSRVFHAAAETFGLPVGLLVAVACCESGGDPAAERWEAHLSDRSIGLTQVLTATALQVGRGIGWPEIGAAVGPELQEVAALRMPARSLPDGGDLAAWRAWLGQPYVAVHLAAAVLAELDRLRGCRGDPIALYAAYNAGGLYASTANPWGLRSAPVAIDAFAQHLNNAVADLGAVAFA